MIPLSQTAEDFLIYLLIYFVKTIQKFIDFYKITKNVFSNSST